MKVGLIGFSQSGKSTLYRAAARGQAKGDVTAVPVPDPRFDWIVNQVQPKKATPATVVIHDDIESLQGSGKMMSPRFLDDARKAELLLHVVRDFDNPVAPYHAEVDPARDHNRVVEELILTDLQMVETRLERLAKSLNARSPGHIEYLEKQLFERIREPLEEGKAVRQMELDEAEQQIARNYQLLSAKPLVVACNVGELVAAAGSDRAQALMTRIQGSGDAGFVVCASLEEEIAQLDPADQLEFLAASGLTEPASHRLIRAVYDALGLITFFTAGENETKAWPLRRGSNALKAASTIHTDIAKGFIRAEVTHFEAYQSAGSLHAANSAGKTSLEGKDYVVQDGDLLNIRNKS